jgi:hypothetical protein
MSAAGSGIGATRRAIVIFQQNMALLPELRMPNGKKLYLGREREAALDCLAYFLLEYLPDLVGLSEMWVGEERRWLREKLGRFYPYFLEGPGEADDLNVDGGLLLLSRLPFLVDNEAVYDPCLGEDCLAQKGVIHGRVNLFGEAPPLDLFLTHLQNPTPLSAGPDMGLGSGGRGKVQAQLDQLAGFIHGSREPRYPALLMGDLNSAAGLPEEYDDLLARLGRPADLWPESGNGGRIFGRQNRQFLIPATGLTFDERSSFALSEVAEGQISDRHETGKRLDYFLSYPGSQWMPNYISTHLVRLESSPGRDRSDQYGLMTELAGLRQT